MIHNDAFPERRRPAHGLIDIPGQTLIVFGTICTKNRVRWLADQAVHELLSSVWKTADEWKVGRYVVMPDHIHLFAGGCDRSLPFGNWVRYWKSQFSKKHQQPEHRWQPDYWETRIRSHAQLEDKWNYIRLNPVRQNLVSRSDDWPYQGVIHELRWE